MKEDSDKHTCGLELSGGLNGITYPQKFVHAKNPNAPGPCNYSALHAPDMKEMMDTME